MALDESNFTHVVDGRGYCHFFLLTVGIGLTIIFFVLWLLMNPVLPLPITAEDIAISFAHGWSRSEHHILCMGGLIESTFTPAVDGRGYCHFFLLMVAVGLSISFFVLWLLMNSLYLCH